MALAELPSPVLGTDFIQGRSMPRPGMRLPQMNCKNRVVLKENSTDLCVAGPSLEAS